MDQSQHGYFTELGRATSKAWSEFWFASGDAFKLSALRVVVGILAICFLLSHTADLTRWFGPNGLLPYSSVVEIATLDHNDLTVFQEHLGPALDRIKEKVDRSTGVTREGLTRQIDLVDQLIGLLEQHRRRVCDQVVVKNVEATRIISHVLALEATRMRASNILIESDLDSTMVSIDRSRFMRIMCLLLEHLRDRVDLAENVEGIISVILNKDSGEAVLTLLCNGLPYTDEELAHLFDPTREPHGFLLHYCSNTIKTFGGNFTLANDGNSGIRLEMKLVLDSTMK